MVRIMHTEVTGVGLKQLDVYNLVLEIIEWGTCRVHVPNPVLRKSLTSIFEQTKKSLLSERFN